LESCDAHHGISPAGFGLADWSIPLYVTQLVVDCLFGETLSPTTADYSYVLVSNESLFGVIDPAFNDLAVSIHKLDKVQLGFD
jgi:hypothetical protein